MIRAHEAQDQGYKMFRRNAATGFPRYHTHTTPITSPTRPLTDHCRSAHGSLYKLYHTVWSIPELDLYHTKTDFNHYF